ncbi:MAG: SDR family NAD(P)-dependent oxidoreductase [Deltaproteobacteria bacterium]|nr:SDR family NAD(P)-dependent oxidoreductase [Deltaproteobacteria bacterium]
MGLLDGKVCIITGAGNGIGKAHALYFAREGARVVVNDLGGARDGSGRAARPADEVVEEIRKAGGDAVADTSNVATLDGAQNLVWAAINRFKRVDVLVNNAGILRDRSMLNMTEEEWDAVIAVHLRGTFLCTRAFGRAVKAQGSPASVVNTTSLSGLLGNFGQANYSSAKAGIYGFTKTVSMEFSKLNTRVNAVAPVALTRMTEDLPMFQGASADEMGPQHICPVVAFLASDLSEGITGKIIGVQGTKVFEYRMEVSEGIHKPSGMWSPQDIKDKWTDVVK